MLLSELDFDLPAELIAQAPAPEREGARLMVLDRSSGGITHARIADLPDLLPAPSLLVVNDTRVLRARLRGHKPSGGAVEILLVRRDPDGTWQAMGRAGSPLKAGTRIRIAPTLAIGVEGRTAEGLLRVRLAPEGMSEDEAIEAHGAVPLPPYIKRVVQADDAERYQTVFARQPGAVAAPTAGLHFTPELLARALRRGISIEPITLHVGPGTFAPVTVERLDDHPMHAEWYEVPARTAEAVDHARAASHPVVAVGTTVVRTLESAVLPGGGLGVGPGETRLLLQPGSSFRLVDRLVTNFHVPRSTLMALVMAFAGREAILEAYREAVRHRYRFYSYGDAMLIQ